MSENLVWKDRKRPFLGLPLSFTRYRLTDDKIIIDTGFLSRKEEEIRLYRIMDVSLCRSFWERIFKLGTIHCCSGDKTSPEFDIKHIKNAKELKEQLSDMIEESRTKHRIGTREYMEGQDDMFDDDDFDEHN